MARTHDPLAAVANPTNRRILCLLSGEPAHPRRVAGLLDLPETEVSRRLRALERSGFVKGAWERQGANVRRYRLVADKVVLSFGPDGLQVRVEQGDGATTGVIRVHDFRVPEVPDATPDPAPLLETLAARRGVLLVGIQGSGATTRAAVAARAWTGPAFWAAIREETTRADLESSLRVFLAEHGHAEEDVLDGVDAVGALLVLDDYHRAEPGVREMMSGFLERDGRGRALLVKSQEPRYVPPGRVDVVRVNGFTPEEGVAFLRFKGVKLTDEQALRLVERVHGHPLSLNFYAEALLAGNLSFEETVDDVPEADLQERILDRAYKALPDREQRLLEAASVLRAPFTSEDLEALTEEPRVRYGLLQLERRLLVQRAEDRYRVHDVLVPYLAKLVSRPKALHEKAARHFEGLGTVEGRILAVHHWVASGNVQGAARVLAHDVPLDAVRRLAPLHGGLYADALTRIVAEALPERARISVEDDLGDLALKEGRLDEARKRFGTVLELAERARDTERAAEARRKLDLMQSNDAKGT